VITGSGTTVDTSTFERRDKERIGRRVVHLFISLICRWPSCECGLIFFISTRTDDTAGQAGRDCECEDEMYEME